MIAIVSGKGGVGKSLVTSMLAVKMQKRGFSAAILDADITGPSIPESFGVGEKRAEAEEEALNPVVTDLGIQLMSMNFLLQNENDPVIWRGPVISGAVQQFWTDVKWKDVDFMFVDMPPGTGDVPLTVFQSLPIDGAIIVTSPQDLVSMIVEKAVRMAEKMNIPILGIIENMSYLLCPHCNEKINVFGESHIEELCQKEGLELLAKLPIDSQNASYMDAGAVEAIDTKESLKTAVACLKKLIKS